MGVDHIEISKESDNIEDDDSAPDDMTIGFR